MKSHPLKWILLALVVGTGGSFTGSMVGPGDTVFKSKIRRLGTRELQLTLGKDDPYWTRRPHSSFTVLQAHAMDNARSSSSSRKQAWPRRIWSKIVTRQTGNKELKMQQVVMDQETEELLESVTAHYHPKYTSNEFIVKDLEEFVPASVINDEDSARSQIDTEFYNVNIRQASTPTPVLVPVPALNGTTISSTKNTNGRAISMSRWLGNLFEIVVTGIIQRNSREPPEGLAIRVEPKGNVMANLFRGQFRANAELVVDRLVFPAIRMSGGRLEIKRLTLQLLGFLGEEGTRFPKQFDLHAHDWIFSKDDLLESPCIRNGLRRLLVRILRDRGVPSSTIQVTSLDILPSGKLSIQGAAKTLFDSSLKFEVRTGIDFTTRGHVLTFPGLEVSINTPLFVPVLPAIDIDVGHNARLRDIIIDGRAKFVRLSASVTITPERTIRLLTDYRQSSEAFSARFSVDVGRWLTNIGNFRR